MPIYNTPGAYIEENSTLPPSIAPGETAIPAFIGYTERATKDGDDSALILVPTRITSLLEYLEIFGRLRPETMPASITDQLDASGQVQTRTIDAALDPSSPSGYLMYYAIEMFFRNGGGPCYIVSIGSYSNPIDANDFIGVPGTVGGLEAAATVDEPTLLVFPDAISLGTVSLYGSVASAALRQCNELQDRFTILDVYDNGTSSAIADFRNAVSSDYLNYGAAYYPQLKTTLSYGYDAGGVTVSPEVISANGTSNPGSFDGDSLATVGLTNPSLTRSIIAKLRELYVTLPPSALMAGVYARVDSDRGVWKAPANVSLNSVIQPTVRVTNDLQDRLNVDATSGKSINAIRTFAGRGILVWGARTLAGNDNEWRYVPVRRLFIFVEESVKKASEFVVFEPKAAKTWVRVKAMIENFLTSLWREGALAGAKPEDAFFVNVGLGQTMTAEDILNGIMNVEIGMAAVRPAEFIILKFSHKLQTS